MPINCFLVLQQQFFVGAVGNRHDIDIVKFMSGFAPVTMSQNMMPTDFAAGFNFSSGRHRPMEQRIESGNSYTAGRWFNMFKKSRKAAENFSRREICGNSEKLVERHACLSRAFHPRR